MAVVGANATQTPQLSRQKQGRWRGQSWRRLIPRRSRTIHSGILLRLLPWEGAFPRYCQGWPPPPMFAALDQKLNCADFPGRKRPSGRQEMSLKCRPSGSTSARKVWIASGLKKLGLGLLESADGDAGPDGDRAARRRFWPRKARWWCRPAFIPDGRAGDKFVVREPSVEKHVWWDNNKAMTPAHFRGACCKPSKLMHRSASCSCRNLFGGADPTHRLPVRVVDRARLALTLHPELADRTCGRRSRPLQSGLHDHRLPGLPSRSGIARHGVRHGHRRPRSKRKLVLIGGTSLRGRDEEVGVHDPQLSAAAQARDADALLGQRGAERRVGDLLRIVGHRKKTTLSADPHRTLVGDDEHGWSDTGVFNFEGRLLRQD